MLWLVAIFLQFLVITLTVNTKNGKITNAELWSLYCVKVFISILVFVCIKKA
jgi:hypothetical protein